MNKANNTNEITEQPKVEATQKPVLRELSAEEILLISGGGSRSSTGGGGSMCV